MRPIYPIVDIQFFAGKGETVIGRLPSGKIALPTRAFHHRPLPGETIPCQIFQETDKAAYVGPTNISFTATCVSGYEHGASGIFFEDEFRRRFEMGSRWCDRHDPPITGEKWKVFAFSSKGGKKYVLPYEEKARGTSQAHPSHELSPRLSLAI